MLEVTSPALVPVVEGEAVAPGVFCLGLPILFPGILVGVGPLGGPPPKRCFGGPNVHGDVGFPE